MNFLLNRIIRRLDEVDSTNRFALDWITSELPPEGSVIIASNQMAGRGQKGTQWKVEKGKNLTCSFIFYPSFLLVSDQFLLSKISALAIQKTILKFVAKDEKLEIKWPNDIYLNGDKIAGILIENSILGNKIKQSVMGIGINVNQKEFPIEFKATSLINHIKNEYDLETIFKYLIEQIDHYYFLLKSGNIGLINREYLESLYLKEVVSNFLFKGEKIKAKITGVSDSGYLELQSNNENIKADLKEIIFLHEP